MTVSPDGKKGNQGAARTQGKTMSVMTWDRQTDPQINIANTRLTQPRGRSSEKFCNPWGKMGGRSWVSYLVFYGTL